MKLQRLTWIAVAGTNCALLLFQGENSSSSSLFASAQPRIINGETVADPTLKYSYFTSLSDNGNHKCGGALIAPDVVITAAHCLGPSLVDEVAIAKKSYENGLSDIDYESYLIDTYVTHPRYYKNELKDNDPYEMALIKIHGRSLVPPIKVNFDSMIPSEAGTDLDIMGFGATDPNNITTASKTFQHGVVKYIPNDECKSIEGEFNNGTVSLEPFILDVSLCAGDFTDPRQDICSGDSGGPIVLEQEEGPLLLGVVSFSVECASPVFPGVYVRTSETIDWISEQVCLLSNDPPSDFNCAPEEEEEDETTMISATLQIQFFADKQYEEFTKPEEIGWVLESTASTKKYYEYRNIFTYTDKDLQEFNEVSKIIEESIMIPNDASYKFTLVQRNNVLVQAVSLHSKSEDGLKEINYFQKPVRGIGNYKVQTLARFDVGTPPTMRPTTTKVPTMSPTTLQELNKSYFSIEIVFDDKPEETGWFMEAILMNDEKVLLDQRYPGDYEGEKEGTTKTEIVPLYDDDETNVKSYRFTMTDNEILKEDGSASVYYNTVDGKQSLLFEITEFFLEDVHEIPAGLDLTHAPVAPTEAPASSPVDSSPVIEEPPGAPTDAPVSDPTEVGDVTPTDISPVVVSPAPVSPAPVSPAPVAPTNESPVVVVAPVSQPITEAPVVSPTDAPVVPPTTLSPVTILTNAPIVVPPPTTLSPVFILTNAPVVPPTDAPVVPPPTDAPVVPPTEAPVVPPTDAPVVPPTDAPVVPPTDAPVVPPTDAPVVPPTDAPVVPPTDAPVVPPTDAPVVPPTEAPVVPPTDEPVVPPTEAPVVPPTDAPIVPPTDAPAVPSPTPAPIGRKKKSKKNSKKGKKFAKKTKRHNSE